MVACLCMCVCLSSQFSHCLMATLARFSTCRFCSPPSPVSLYIHDVKSPCCSQQHYRTQTPYGRQIHSKCLQIAALHRSISENEDRSKHRGLLLWSRLQIPPESRVAVGVKSSRRTGCAPDSLFQSWPALQSSSCGLLLHPILIT